ncbi:MULTISPECIES: hypothetical protein [Methylopilaceae]|uniref:Uncharacterized protein n=2 Tax=Methylopilaceae TaxID=3149309 RepID=A0A4Q0M9Q5_9HYPH|nr:MULTISPECIES: hypothetical protein [Methylocystaceae]QZO00596.1 hypothetical protein K6K41_02400 [Chenggangzhangella methanolivorans]RXF69941.1 hypothetical protein EK403_17565 [Hansschlegelia zhihuaiae]
MTKPDAVSRRLFAAVLAAPLGRKPEANALLNDLLARNRRIGDEVEAADPMTVDTDAVAAQVLANRKAAAEAIEALSA